MRIYLSGFFRVGKTTVGTALASKLELPFFDTDALLEQREGVQVPHLYKKVGECGFREMEGEILESLPLSGVIALGGGTLLREENHDLLKGINIYLKTSLKAHLSLLKERGFPSFVEKENCENECRALALDRFPLYERLADHTIDVEGLEVSKIVLLILNELRVK